MNCSSKDLLGTRTRPARLSMPAAGSRHKWFDKGYEAFSTAFPQIAAKIPFHPFYVCPLCLTAVKIDRLSREDVPPKNIGGRKIVLTCARCNSRAGHDMDDDMRLEADLHNFATGGTVVDHHAVLRTQAGRVPIQLSAEARSIRAVVVGAATRPGQDKAIEADFSRAANEGKWHDYELHIEFEPFSIPKAATSWLRSAYLAFFTLLGYRFILRPEMQVVRNRITHPESELPSRFRIICPQPVREAQLVQIDAPAELRSFAMFYDRNIVLLPQYGDPDLYDRLVRQPNAEMITASGGIFDWPTKPSFLHDFVRVPPP
jgi:hypothetical protein